MKMIIKRRLAGLLVAGGLAGGTLLGGASAAQATGESLKSCSPWANTRLVQTSTTWGRVRTRTCLNWINYGNRVRAQGQIQVDWPTGCFVSNCNPSDLLKVQKVAFSTVRMDMTWNLAGRTAGGYCSKTNWVALEYPSTTVTYTCNSAWYTHPLGTYSTNSRSSYTTSGNVITNPSDTWSGTFR